MKMKRILLTVAMSLCFVGLFAQSGRTEKELKSGWKFFKNENIVSIDDVYLENSKDVDSYSSVGFDDSVWESVCVPHDWAISGPFDNNNDRQTVAIAQNGETVASEKTGRTGSLPWCGVGWYRTHFTVNRGCERAILNFDGAMSEPEVYVNGEKAGEWKYGYNAFNIDITPYLNNDGQDNVLAVRLINLPQSSRWYPGAGIYRPVKLIQTQKKAVEEWGIAFETKSIDVTKKCAEVAVQAQFVGCEDGEKVKFELCGKTVKTTVKQGKAECSLTLKNIAFWTPETPVLYDLKVSLIDGRKTLDEVVRKVGIRTLSFTDENGFQLNGTTRKFKGVCLHHDLGMVGTAVNKAIMTRQLKLLKTMGCDAIRTSHNMPSQMQMDLCDSLGLMVMAESFDMWVYPKCKNGYNLYYKEWWQRDLTNLVLANRLHPSIVMWSIGNEIPEQSGKEGARMCKEMIDLMHQLDSTRLCTSGVDNVDNALRSGFLATLDIPGLNYRVHRYDAAHEGLGNHFILGSETASTISSRGVYHFPVKLTSWENNADGQCSSYDLGACSWSNVPEVDWTYQDDAPWCIGEFVWTGFDYLGEPTPYDDRVNARSSYFGIFDLAGLPKDRYWLYRSRWNTECNTIHLLPHWTWKGREGEMTPVFCYTNYPTAELFVNGKSQGKITKKAPGNFNVDGPQIDRYRLRWNDVKYEPGELRVVVYDASGKPCGEQIVKTAGELARLVCKLETLDEYSNPATLKADGDDMAFFTIQAVDENGNLCPDAVNQIEVKVDGAAQFKGMCNGDATSFEVFTRPTMKLFHGMLVVGIQSNGQKGPATITVSSPELSSSSCTIMAK